MVVSQIKRPEMFKKVINRLLTGYDVSYVAAMQFLTRISLFNERPLIYVVVRWPLKWGYIIYTPHFTPNTFLLLFFLPVVTRLKT